MAAAPSTSPLYVPPHAALLFVDDNTDLQETVRMASEHLGIERCVTAGSLAEVEHQAREALACSLALLDINLGFHAPSGLDVFRWLQDEHFAGQIVFLTGHGDSNPRVRQAAELGDTRILLKPVGIEVLAELVMEAGKRR